MGKQLSYAILLLIILLVGEYGIYCSGEELNGCIASERKALMKFRANISDPYDMLSSWNTSKDCCLWQGVTCDKLTRNVIGLDLQVEDNSYFPIRRTNETLDSSLLELTDLSYLALGGSSFTKLFPTFFGSMMKLRYLDLSRADFYGVVPHELGNLSKLEMLDLSQGRNLHFDDFTWVSGLLSLKHLDLNFVDLRLAKDVFKVLNMLPSLVHINLASTFLNNTNLQHACKNSVLNFAIQYLDLSGNSFAGEFPCFLHSLGQLSNLKQLKMSSNSLNNTLTEAHFAKLSNLEYLDISFNNLKFGVGSGWVPPFQLEHLEMQSCEIGGEFPEWLQSQKRLTYLDLSDCGLLGTLPQWRQMNFTSLQISNNHIEGPIPNSLCEMKYLQILDLSKNQLSGNLPECLGTLQELAVLRLSSNNLSGVIPNSLGEAYSLIFVHLNHNNFTGNFPSNLRNCSYMSVLDIGENFLSGKLPKNWTGADFLQTLRLRNNDFYGTIPSGLCQLSLQLLDLANNELTGNIPHCFGEFYSMTKDQIYPDGLIPPEHDVSDGWQKEELIEVQKGLELEYSTTSESVVIMDLSNNNLIGEIPLGLTNLSGLIGFNLSHNHLQGEIPRTIGDMKSLESLDLSNNNLSGRIPDSISDLNFLSRLNLSHNNLSGPIPTGHQLQTLADPSIYDGNTGLCGPPLLKKCKESKSPNVEIHDATNESDKAGKIWLYAFIVSGFATGFCGAIGVLVYKISWRHSYFNFAEEMLHKIIRK